MNQNKHLFPRIALNRFIASYSDDTQKNDNILQKHIKNIINKEKVKL